MSDSRAQDVGVWGRIRIRHLLVGIPALLFAGGLGLDACSGLPVSQGARSPQAWLAGILAFGALYVIGEGVSEAIASRDRITDPLWLRVVRLIMLLAGAVALFFSLRLVASLVR